MASLLIPITTEDPSFKFSIDLEGVTYVLSFSYNSRMDRWTMSILDQNGVALRSGIKLITGWNLKRQYVQSVLPPGGFAVIDLANETKNPNFDDFGQRTLLYYEESNG